VIALGPDVGRSANPRKKAKKEKKDTTDMPSRCERSVMLSKAHEASFHGHFANLPVEVCSTLKLQPLTNKTL
jgi:hypothetical protein